MNNKQENIIIWQKWADPFGEKTEEESIEENIFYDKEDQDIDQEKQLSEFINQPKPVKVIATPMGIIPMNDDTASGKIFNFWIGHTNFSITENISNLIESCDGIESLDVFTRYRFRIAIGKAFIDSVIMKNIQDTIYEYLENTND